MLKGTVVFLAVQMAQGFGVSVVIAQLAKHLEYAGASVVVGCLETDGSFDAEKVCVVEATRPGLLAFLRRVGAAIVIAKTSPFFELLPYFTHEFTCMAWEQGDPSPAFFDEDRAHRERIVRHKREAVYGQLHSVITSSRFLRQDIAWPSARVIPLGCDHVLDLGPKPMTALAAANGRPLQIGTLMRLGAGEARYKGNRIFLDLHDSVRHAGLDATFHVLGRGTPADARPFEDAGCRVHLNATDAERAVYLRNLDIFVSCSLWEGFNLPLVEAQAAGTVGLAFDTGAHPEVTPFVMSCFDDLLGQIRVYAEDRELLLAQSVAAYRFVRQRFRWDLSAYQLQARIAECAV
ncbi:MAG: glycosyltransferase family 4 protein [Vicinamibacterales bacterium]